MRVEVADRSRRGPSPGADGAPRTTGWSVPTWTIAAAALTLTSMLFPAGPGAQALVMIGVVLVPGASAAALVGIALDGPTRRIFLASVMGVAVLLAVGLVSVVALRPLGIAHPLTRGPMLVAWTLVLVACVVAAARVRRDPVQWMVEGLGRPHALWLAGLAILPAFALLGSGRLNAGHGGALAVGVSAACVGVLIATLVSALWHKLTVPASPAIFMSVVALVWQVTSRGAWLFGTDVQHEYFVANHAAVTGQFSLTSHQDPYQAMLPLTVLPAQLHALTTASVEVLLQLLPAVVLGLVAVGALCIFRALVPEGWAVAFTLLFVGVNTAFLSELPTITRQCYGLLMFEAITFVIVVAPSPIRRARVLAATLGVVMAVSHYSTAFIAVPVLALGWVFSRRFSTTPADAATRPERSVLSAVVVGVSALATVLWGLVVAGSGTQLSQLRSSLRANGFAIFPSTGGVLTRWINASTKTSVSAEVLQRLDEVQTRRVRPWLKIDPRALHEQLVDAAAPKRAAVPLLRPISTTLLALANQLLLAASVLAVIAVVVWLVRGRGRLRADLVGMAVGAVAIGAIARVSGTVAQYFGPERVQVQLGVLLLLPLAVLVATAPRPSPRILRAGVLALVVVELAGATGLSVIAFGGVPAAHLSASGENVERFTVNTPDRYAARWVVDHSGKRILQSDPFAKLAIANFTGAARKNSVDSVDPVAVDHSAWIYASPVNIALGRARGMVNGAEGVFVFPRKFYDRTRPIIFATDNSRIYGPVCPDFC